VASVLGFPNPVNEKAARVVAAGVLLISFGALATQTLWLTAVLALGFALRVATVPTLSPLGQLATRVVAPRLGSPKLVAGPPKRFAQGVGLTVTASATIAWFGFGSAVVASSLLGLLVVAAGLESIFGVCLGCIAFGYLMRRGLVPADTCRACNDISVRVRETT
jgi:hypothetical protein